jgi:hypothetical protein
LPFIILSWILAVLIFSFFFLFFFKQAFNEKLIFSALSNSNSTLSASFRHVFNFFTKAWLFDIFIAKLARVFFLMGRIFIQRFIENGLFEYVLVLYPVRKLQTIGHFLVLEGSMSGRLSVYLFNILLGGFFVFIAFCFLVFSSFILIQ